MIVNGYKNMNLTIKEIEKINHSLKTLTFLIVNGYKNMNLITKNTEMINLKS